MLKRGRLRDDLREFSLTSPLQRDRLSIEKGSKKVAGSSAMENRPDVAIPDTTLAVRRAHCLRLILCSR